MDAVTFIRQALTQAHERLIETLADLTDADTAWRPAPNTNAILEIAWHVARVDDRLGRRSTALGPELWESGWRERLGFANDIPRGESYQFLKRAGVAPPKLDDVAAYLTAVHDDTMLLLRGLSASDLDRVPDARQPDRQVATYFRHMITHKNNHHGQIDFIRGLLHPGWDLSPGTGIVQR